MRGHLFCLAFFQTPPPLFNNSMTEREPKSILEENEYLCILQYMHYDFIYIFENPLGKKTINAILTISK